MRKNIFVLFLTFILLCALPCSKVSGDVISNDSEIELFSEEHKQIWYQVEGGNPVRAGGVSEIDGVYCKNEDDTEELENHLRISGYILVTTDEKEISDEEYNLLCNNGTYLPPYSYCFNSENEYYWTKCKVYMYEKSYNDAISQLRENGFVNMITRSEITTSTVVVNYAEWYEKERVGKIVNEFNDALPSWYENESGFLCVISPIDAEVTMEYYAEHTLNVFYVKANEPFLIKMKHGGHLIKSINSQQIDEEESSLVYSNNIQILNENTEENPYILRLEKTVSKYNIPSVDISDKPDYSWNSGVFIPIEDIPEESVIVEEKNSASDSGEKRDSRLIWSIIFISVASVFVVTAVIIFKVIKKKNSQF